MYARITTFIFVTLLLSCKKDSQNEPVTLLSKMETILAGETVTTTIKYDNAKPVLIQTLGTSAGKSVNIMTRFIRNKQGIIEKIIIKNPAYLTTFTVDSIIYIVNYSAFNNRYTNMVNDLFFKNGITEHDSTIFTYDAEEMITQATKLINNGSSINYQEAERNEFTYVNGNLIRCKNYIFNSLYLEQNIVYDARNNPTGFGKESILIGSTRNNRNFEQASSNNAIVTSYHRNGTVSTITTTYTYYLNDYPAMKTEVLSNGSTQTTTYYY